MKRIYLVLIYLFCCGVLWAQCPPGSLNITSQAQIDNFAINYPNCTQIFGGITIDDNSATPIYNLNGLSQITSIGGDIRVFFNNYLTSLKGLDNIDFTDIQGLRIEYNQKLEMCDIESVCGYLGNGGSAFISNNKLGCKDLQTVAYFCTIDNPCLLDGIVFYSQQDVDDFAVNYPDCETIMGPVLIWGGVSNLNGLSQLKGHRGRDFEIRNTTFLTSLSGLENLTCIKYDMLIGDNDSLSDISALANVDYIGIDSLSIYNNPNLSDCSIESVCEYIENNKPFSIYNNAGDCNNPIEVISGCGASISSCLTGGITFSTQSQIDNFLSDYPDCQYIDGDVIIKGNTPTSITNLNGLNTIQFINGRLIIEANDALNYLDGLEQLTVIKNGLEINNNQLLNLNALKLAHVNGALIIRNNPLIEDLFGLENIFPNTISDLQIYNNPQLTFCSVTSICRYLNFPIFNPSGFIQDNASGCNSIEEVAFESGCFILPIELTHFQAQIQNKATLLTWQTATETHNKGFEIQRSKDAITWEKVAWQDGQGDSQTPHDYTYKDENPLSGTSYYRLKQIDFDGTFTYSDIVNVDYVGRTDISIYPNPVKSTLHIADLNDNTIQNISIFDQMGRQVILQDTKANTLDVSALASGVYIIQVVLDNGIFSDRFIVK